jgi:hypothetical protein
VSQPMPPIVELTVTCQPRALKWSALQPRKRQTKYPQTHGGTDRSIRTVEGAQKIDDAPLTSHELSSDRRESQSVHDRRREERQRSQRHAVTDISQIMREHPWAEQGLHNFPLRGVLIGVSTSFDFDASFDELLVVLGKELGARRVVGQEEECQQGAEYRDEAFDDELKMDGMC